MLKIEKLNSKIQKMSLMRLKHEERDKDEKLKDSSYAFYKKPMEYAMDIYSYYTCFKCKSPFFGGAKACGAMMAEIENNKEFKE